MKFKIKSILLFHFLFLFIRLEGFSQTIKLELKDKERNEPIYFVEIYIIDPVDSMVVGFAISDFDGFSNINLLRPLKSSLFNIKVCDIYLKDTLIELKYEYNKIYNLKLEYQAVIEWFTVYYSKDKIEKFDCMNSYFNCSKKYQNSYYDSLVAKENRINKNALDNYQVEYSKYLNEKRWVDSMNSISNQIQYGYPPEPVSPVFIECCDPFYVVEPIFPEGNLKFLEKLFYSKSLKLELDKKKCIYIDFELSGYDFVGDNAIVYNKKNIKLKKSSKIWDEIKPILQIKWKPMNINGRRIKLSKEKRYRIEFVYIYY